MAVTDDQQYCTTITFVPCRHCGYDLRGRPQEGHCPECGASYRIAALYKDVLNQRFRDLILTLEFLARVTPVVTICLGICFFTLVSFNSDRLVTAVMAFLCVILGLAYLIISAANVVHIFTVIHLLVKQSLTWQQLKLLGLRSKLIGLLLCMLLPFALVAMLV